VNAVKWLSYILVFICGTLFAWFYPHFSYALQSKEPEQAVIHFVQAQVAGKVADAQSFLTGEAKEKISHLQPGIPDPFEKVEIASSNQNENFAQVTARSYTKQDALTEEFYLTKQKDQWKIYSIQLPTPHWETMSSTKVKEEQKQTIEKFTSALANGDTQDAIQQLVDGARIRALSTKVSGVKQTIHLDSMTPVGALNNGDVLIQVKESLSSGNETLLYTLTPLPSSQWKISDVRLVEKKVS
jgi:hypothetical protein